MRIVIATPLYPPEIGGPATYAKLLEEGLPGKDIEVELVKFSEVRHLPKLIRHIAYYHRVLRAARNADVVFALDPVSVGLPAMKAAQKAGKPFVVKIVGDYAWEQGQQRFGVTENLDEFVKSEQKSFFVRRLQKIQTYVAKNATRIIVPSEYLKGIVAAWGIPKEKISKQGKVGRALAWSAIALMAAGIMLTPKMRAQEVEKIFAPQMSIGRYDNGKIAAVQSKHVLDVQFFAGSNYCGIRKVHGQVIVFAL